MKQAQLLKRGKLTPAPQKRKFIGRAYKRLMDIHAQEYWSCETRQARRIVREYCMQEARRRMERAVSVEEHREVLRELDRQVLKIRREKIGEHVAQAPRELPPEASFAGKDVFIERLARVLIELHEYGRPTAAAVARGYRAQAAGMLRTAGTEADCGHILSCEHAKLKAPARNREQYAQVAAQVLFSLHRLRSPRPKGFRKGVDMKNSELLESFLPEARQLLAPAVSIRDCNAVMRDLYLSLQEERNRAKAAA